MYQTIVRVFPSGPPLVMMKIWVKTWNEPRIEITNRKSVVDESSGKVMSFSRRQPEAPSILAAS